MTTEKRDAFRRFMRAALAGAASDGALLNQITLARYTEKPKARLMEAEIRARDLVFAAVLIARHATEEYMRVENLTEADDDAF